MRYSKNSTFSFEEVMLLHKKYLDYIHDSIKKNFSKISNNRKRPYQFMNIFYNTKEIGGCFYSINYKDIHENKLLSFNYVITNYGAYLCETEGNRRWGNTFCTREIDLYHEHKKSFSLKYTVKGVSFYIQIDGIINLDDSSQNNQALFKITNENSGELEEYYYDYEKRTIAKKVEQGNLELPEDLKNQLLENLPKLNFKDLPYDLKEYIKLENWEIDFTPKEETEDDQKKQGFMATIANSYSPNTSSLDNRESIKQILIRLKEARVELKPEQKFRIPDSLFFIEITDNKKTIDPFFNDEDIIKYCDLSKINFTNADIRGFYLANTNASISLRKVYNGDITNANLENVKLPFQDLAGIIADGVNLKGTCVTVSIDKTSIINTKFDTRCSFFLGGRPLPISIAKDMGLDIYDQTETVAQLKI